MSELATFFLPVIIVATVQLASQVSSQPISPTFTYAFCRSKYGNYTTKSTYESNLKTVISELEAYASIGPFHDTSIGNGTNTVYGQYYCRGDLHSSFCSDCIKAAALHALNCSNARDAVIWYQECTLRYKNESMFSVSEEKLTISSYSKKNLTDPETFSPILNKTVGGLVQEAVSGNFSSVKYLAFGETEVSAFMTAYFLVQCSPDLNATQCVSCFGQAFSFMLTCCGEWPTIQYSLTPSCQVVYNTDGLFYFTSNAPPSPPPPLVPSSSPPPPPSQITVVQSPPPPSTGGSTNMREISGSMKPGIVTAAVVLSKLLFK